VLTVDAAVVLPHVIREPLSSAVATVRVLMQPGHPYNAFVYAPVYSDAPKFYSRARYLW
jgi:hypothetical protein